MSVSIIIPTFNRQDYIAETLDSVLKQTLQDWECIIVDDGSTDRTEDLIYKYISSDSRFSFYKRPQAMQKGANSCRNFGFTRSKKEYVKFLDSDDLLTEQCLEKQVEAMEASKHLKVCFSYGRYFNSKTKELEEFWSRNKIYSNYLLGHVKNQIRWAISDPLWRKSFFSVPPFEEGLMNSQEWLMHGQAVLKLQKNQIWNMQEVFTLIRRGNARMSSVRTSFYYKNQRKARLLLLKRVLLKKPQSLAVQMQLIKQILVFTFWAIKSI